MRVRRVSRKHTLRPASGTLSPANRLGVSKHVRTVRDMETDFEAEIAEHGPAAVLATWAPVLLPGAFAAAGTGVLRTATGLRALVEAGEYPPSLREALRVPDPRVGDN